MRAPKGMGLADWWGMWGIAIGAIGLTMLLGPSAASAQAWWTVSPNGIPEPSIATSLPSHGDPADFRKRLADRGVVYGLEYTNDFLSNLRGGNRTGTIDQGKLQGILTGRF